MKKFIEIEGKQYRVLVCWNAVSMFLKEKGMEDISEFGNLSKMTASDMLIMLYWSLYYGEDSENRVLPYSSSDKLGNVIGMAQMKEFISIFVEQITAQVPQEANSAPSNAEIKKKKYFWQK